jgi:hypothetical protein
MNVDALLDQLVPEPQSFGNWDDVLARAGIRRRNARRPVIVAAVVAALLVVLFATPAFGVLLDLIGRTDVPFGHTEKAPVRVQREFFDQSLAAPHGMAPQAIVSETRRVGTLGGRELYLAPTRTGGFCWQLEHSVGGCNIKTGDVPLSLGWGGLQRRSGGPFLVRQVYGEVFADRAETVTLEYADGTTQQLPFIWVSRPIDVGFFAVDLAPEHQTGAARVAAVAVRDGHGRLLARRRIVEHRVRPPVRHAPPPRSYRPPPLPAPAPPLQRASASGVDVIVGRNGIAEFHVTGSTLHGASWACFKFVRYHRVEPFELGYAAQAVHGDRIQLGGLRGPVDGCEVQAPRGHTWPDPLGYHAAAEIAFTDHARRWFADRAAARKLALYLRWSRHHPHAPTTGITITRARAETTYSVRSTTGKRFAVTTRDGRVVRQNVRPYAGPL